MTRRLLAPITRTATTAWASRSESQRPRHTSIAPGAGRAPVPCRVRHRTARAAVVSLVCAGVIVASAAATLATPGSLDPSFGATGIVTTSHEVQGDDSAWSEAHAVTVAPDGKIVVAGASTFWEVPFGGVVPPTKFFVARYHTNGARDTTLADLGGDPIVTDFAGEDDAALAVLVQPDGRIVAAGSATIDGVRQFALVRYLDDGTLDASFGDGGRVVTTWEGDGARIHALALLPNGRIIAAGWAQLPGGTQIALARYRADGTLDNGFGTSGRATLSIGGQGSSAIDLARQADGKLVVTGRSGGELAVARFNANGNVDAGFGDGGAVTFSAGLADVVGLAVAIRPDGGIVAAFSAATDEDEDDGFLIRDVALVSLLSDGTLDPWFGIDHVVTRNVTGPEDHVRGLEIDAQGRLLVVARGSNRFGLVRFLPHGDVDLTFGDGGTTVTQLDAPSVAEAFTLQADGKPVVVGHRPSVFANSPGRDIFLARYLVAAQLALDLDLVVTPRRDGLTDIVAVTRDRDTGGALADVRLRFLVDGEVVGLAATDAAGEARVDAPRGGLRPGSVVRVEVVGDDGRDAGGVDARYHPRTGIDTRDPGSSR